MGSIPASSDTSKGLALPVGALSPLWLAFVGAAGMGVAFWWMTRWTRAARDGAQILKFHPLAAPTVEPLVVARAVPEPEPTRAVGEPAVESPMAEAVAAPRVEAVAPPAPAPVSVAPSPASTSAEPQPAPTAPPKVAASKPAAKPPKPAAEAKAAPAKSAAPKRVASKPAAKPPAKPA